ncbi:MAG: histidine phosphatase family protein [Candidatus Pacebacteria bacterium]|nr:histidine phosphatase family protein [Candidatus Paceibacterota bacterium]
MLKQIFLVRHAQSEEDVDPNIRNRAHDHRISVTAVGKKQVVEVAELLRPKIALYNQVRVIVSSSNRAQQTMHLFSSHFPDKQFEIVHEECVRNLNWGNVDETTIKEVEQERYRVGVLYFQFPEGDDTRVLVRNIEKFVDRLLVEGRRSSYSECVMIFTHGFALRVIAKALLSISDEDFRYLSNPPNCYVATLNLTNGGIALEEPLPKVIFKI